MPCYQIVRGALILLLTGCADLSTPVAPPDPPLLRPDADRPVTRLTIRPDLTDPAINVALDDYIVRAPQAGSNGRLFLYLPSSRVGPWTGEVVQAEAARLGYHVAGLSYPNDPGLVSFCGPAADPHACYESTRLEVITGEDLSSFVAVSPANSIDNRLTRLLEYLVEHHPDDGWARFLEGGTPKWSHIAVGGHSQGAGFAAMLGKLRRIDRAVMLSGVTDAVLGIPANWVGLGATPASRHYGLAHQQDNQFRPGILANWGVLAMTAFGAAVAPEASAPPYDGARMFLTNVTPSNGSFLPPAPHGSTGVDLFTPMSSGVPVLRPVWQYMLGYCPPPGTGQGGLVPCQTDH